MRVIFCGGGTAGHVTPALAIANELMSSDANSEVLFVGRKDGSENKMIEKCGYKIKTIEIRGFERKLSIKNLKNLHIALKALQKSKDIIKSFFPDIVVGTGGYVCWPVISMANRLGIKTVIHESNAAPGLVTKLLSKKCDRVLLNFKGAEKEFKRKDNIQIVGNPVRKEFITVSKKEARKKLGIRENEILISSFGGSGGSEKINEAMISLMKNHSAKNKNVKHIHSAGNKYFNEIKQLYPELTENRWGCIVKPYVEDMPNLILASDIVISRCGAMTLSEICISGVAGILVPSPNVTNNHQYKNAKLISDANAGILLEEENLNERTLLDLVKKLEYNEIYRRKIGENARNFFVRNSSEIIVKTMKELVN